MMVAIGPPPTELAQMSGLRAQGVDLDAVVAPDSPHGDSIAVQGVPVQTIHLGSHFDWKAIRCLRRRIREEGVDIVHGLANRPVGNLSWASIGLPVKLVAYRGAIGHVNRWDPGAWLEWYNPRAEHIVCVSDAVREDLVRSGIRLGRLSRIYRGHDLSWQDGLTTVDLQALGSLSALSSLAAAPT